MSTPYHAGYFAHELPRLGGDGVERLSHSLIMEIIQWQKNNQKS